jgi:ATP-binding cassette subfamily F protein 3
MNIAYFAQHQLDELDAEGSAYDAVRRLMPDAPEAKVRARTGQIGFPEQKANTKVSSLSGGEKARLLLGLATFAGPHLIILDEPTNHLDIDSRAALIEAINDYPGATILVSHDRHLLDACADRLWLVANGRVAPFDGDLDDYRRRVLTDRSDTDAPAKSERAAKPQRDEARRNNGERRSQTASLRQKVTKAEADMARLTREIEKLDAALASGELYASDPAKAAALAKTRSEHARVLAQAEEEWLAAGEALQATS